jgi:class 3 adenylate cyclase
METKNLAIMFTDMKGFTTLSSTQSRAQLQHLLDLQDSLMRPSFQLFGGRVVKTIGDGFMVVFESPTNAVLCGMKIQENILNHNAIAPSSDQFEVRIAVNAGEVSINADGDVFGEAVNIASRIESISEPNEVYFTESIYLSMNKNEIPTADVGERHLKGIPQAVKVYKVLQERTALIANRIKRAEQANLHANLAKGETHDAGAKELPANTATLFPTESFLKKYRKVLIIAIIGVVLVMAFFAVASTINKLNEKIEQIDTQLPQNNINQNQPLINQNIQPKNIEPQIQNQALSLEELVTKAKDLTVQKRWQDLIKLLNQAMDASYPNYTENEKQRFRELIKNIMPQVPADSPPLQALKDILNRAK